VGTATLSLSNAGGAIGTLSVNVVAPGTAVRWPGAINADVDGQTAFDRPANARIYSLATAPYNGATATGVVRVTSNGQELARLTLPASVFGTVLPFYSPGVGTQPIRIEYAGDANFLPMTFDRSLVTVKGSVTVTSSADRSGPNATLHLRVTGSPMADPSGTLTISETSVVTPKQVTLTGLGGGLATADVTLTNLSPGIHTLQVSYSGDTHYSGQNQNVRLLEEHRHAAAH
jgi:hypothetical protein